jgi:hypothetical protein
VFARSAFAYGHDPDGDLGSALDAGAFVAAAV